MDSLFIIIFTDLDGTLLDHETYGWKDAKPALRLCAKYNIPVIIVSSKTRAEIDLLRKKLGLTYPFISENGGGVFFPKESTPSAPSGAIFSENAWKWSLGLPYHSLVESLMEIRDELDLKIKGFSEMTLKEISHLTGLDSKNAGLAARREFDEPFIMDQKSPGPKALYKAAAQRGLNITTGGRFYHLQGKIDKGMAVEKLIAWYRADYNPVFTIALGDSPNDFCMLKKVNHPVLIRSLCHFPDLQKSIPGLIMTKDMGPKGWDFAIQRILNKKLNGGSS